MSLALISGPYFIKLVHLSILNPGPDFIKQVRVRILSILSPGPGFGSYQGSPEGESRSGFYQFLSPGPDFIHRVQVRSGFYLFLSPDPDFIKHVRVRVRILPTPGQYL